jgi:hypothetical protein
MCLNGVSETEQQDSSGESPDGRLVCIIEYNTLEASLHTAAIFPCRASTTTPHLQHPASTLILDQYIYIQTSTT